MLLEDMFALIQRQVSRLAKERADEEGAEITRRLHELLDLEKQIQDHNPPDTGYPKAA